MKAILSIVAAAALAGCLDWAGEAEALRQTHVHAVETAASTNQFEVLPAEVWP